MGRVTLTLPRLGETMEEAKVVDWLIAPGMAYRRGDVLLEVETDKTVVEVPALSDGTLQAQLVAPGDMVALDQPIAEVEVEGAKDTEPPFAAKPVAITASGVAPVAQTPAARPAPVAAHVLGAEAPRPAASPAARAAARRAGVDLTLIRGTGRRGRIMAADISGAGHQDLAVHRSGGSGTPVVLLHGLFDDVRGWRDLPRRLGAHGHAVFAIDLPGHGASAAQADNAERALDLIEAHLPEGPLHLVGHSLGAALAVKLARRIGARAVSLVLLAPAGLGARINTEFTEGMLCAQTPAALSRALSLLDAGPVSALVLEQELARMQALRDGQAALCDAVARGGFQQIDITADLAQLTSPVTVVFGTADRILDWRDVAQLPASTAIHLIRGAGHLPHAANPDLIVGLIPPDGPDARERATG